MSIWSTCYKNRSQAHAPDTTNPISPSVDEFEIGVILAEVSA